MPPLSIPRPLVQRTCLFKSSSSSFSSSHNLQFKRHEATYRRHIKKLSLPPSPDFLPQTASTKTPASHIVKKTSSHIIFNPPPTAPNVYHTPLKFLPRDDRRRKLYTSPSLPSIYNAGDTTTAASPTSKPGTALHETARPLPPSLLPRIPASAALPPALKETTAKKYHLTSQQVTEMQRLRREDPDTWTLETLAAKYACSTFFVRICAKNAEKGEREARKTEAVMERWGNRKRMAREDRVRRKELWGRDA